jgi:hypothetical protein
MPLPSVWGPSVWELLHGIGWKAGRKPIQRLQIDERREVLWLLSHLDYIIPCPECKTHIITYRKKEGLPEQSTEVAAWLWTFHEAVNERLGKGEGPPFTHSLGENKPLQTLYRTYLTSLQESFKIAGHLRIEQVKEWSRHFQLWLACF